MRILEIVADGKPGGGTTHVLQILRGLRDSISFQLVSQKDSYLLREAKALGIPCYGLDFFHSRGALQIPIQLRRICATVEPNIVHAHGERAGFFCTLAFPKVPIVYAVHGFHLLYKSTVLRWLALQAERIVFKYASHVVFVSQYDAGIARSLRLLDQRMTYDVIYHGAAFNNIPQANSISLRHIGFIGRLEYQKDPFLFLDVLEHLPDYSAIIVGSGKLETCLRKEVRRRGLTKRVQMLGALSHSETLKVLSTLSTLVLTSRWEGLPLVVLESMWIGVPVVSVNVSGISEAIEHGKSGLLVEQRSGKDLARAVIQLTQEDLGFRSHVIENARIRARCLFFEERMLLALKKVYQEALLRAL